MTKEKIRLFLYDANEKKWYLIAFAMFVLIYFYAYSAIGAPLVQSKFKASIIIPIIILGVFFIILSNSLLKLEYLVLCLILTFGSFSVFLTPILGVPDEQVHLARAEATSRFDLFPYPDEDGYYTTIESVSELTAKARTTYNEQSTNTIDYSDSTMEIFAVSNSFIGYIPQAIGVGIAKLFNLPAIGMMYLGRITNLIFSAILAFFAVKISHKAKPLIFVCCCFPLQVYLAASLSIDAFINYGSLLIVALILNYSENNNTKIKNSNIWLLMLLMFCVATCKLTYAALSLLIFFIPNEKIDRKNPVLFKTLFVLGILILSVIFYLITLQQSSPISFKTYLTENNINQTEQISFVLNHPLVFFTVLIREPISCISNLFLQFNGYGWFEYYTPFLGFLYLAFFGAFSLLYPLEIKFSKSSRIFAVLICLAVYFGTLIIMYLSWTPVGSVWIEGVQSRYFIPLLTLLPIIFNLNSVKFISEESRKKTDLVITVFLVFLLACMNISTLVQFY